MSEVPLTMTHQLLLDALSHSSESKISTTALRILIQTHINQSHNPPRHPTQSDLARHFGVTAAGISCAIKQLSIRGLLTKTRLNCRDERLILLEVTPKGRDFLQSITKPTP